MTKLKLWICFVHINLSQHQFNYFKKSITIVQIATTHDRGFLLISRISDIILWYSVFTNMIGCLNIFSYVVYCNDTGAVIMHGMWFENVIILSAFISLDNDAIYSVKLDWQIVFYRYWPSKSNATIHLTL